VPVIPATWEVEIRRILVPGQTLKKTCETLSQLIKVGHGDNTCHPSYMGEVVNKRITIQARQGITVRPYSKST
jgi:hypothetical protein